MTYRRADLNALCDNLNTRLKKAGASFRYETQSRNGYLAVDLFSDDTCVRNIGIGTAKECAFSAMEHALTIT